MTNIQGLNGNSYMYRPVVYLVEGSVGSNLNNKTVTLSFMMKASHNGVYNVAFGKGNDLEFYNTEFEYSGSGKAQKITLTVSVASNAYNESLKRALEIYFFYQVDSSHIFQSDTNLNRWGGQYLVTSKALKWQQITGAWMQIAQVQLEEGATATAFEQRPIGLEIELCQRYLQKWQLHYSSYNPAQNVTASVFYQTRMRYTGNIIVTSVMDEAGIKFAYRITYQTPIGFRFNNDCEALPLAQNPHFHVYGYTEAEM